ncbi:ISNCY family transposase [Lacticaseibacillus sp. N501-2]|uniref:ISNCY family transposase n=1 Tax=Lacticaseibacillus salsurae TaxID=3367729 RepID=UPI0038B2B96B
MKEVVLTMKEDQKYKVIKNVAEHRSSRARACLTLNLSDRQVRRLTTQYAQSGKSAFRHGNAGKTPANKISVHTKNQIVKLYTTKYEGFNIKHFHEFLIEREKIQISESSVRRILRERHCLSPKAHRATKRAVRKELKKRETQAKPLSKRELQTLQAVEPVDPIKAHPSRARKKNIGELIQMDGSQEYWLGSDHPKITLHLAVDDASGTVVGAWFEDQETLQGYFQVFAQILRQHGVPYEILTDRRTVFNSNKKAGVPGLENPLTTFGYACQTLGTQLSVTSIPQAKGRIERMIQTFQSRLRSELKLAEILSREEANQFLETYLPRFNDQFALPSEGITSVYDTQLPETEIERTLIIPRERTISKGHTIQLDTVTYQTYKDDELICLPPKTKVLAIQTYTGKLYATDKADNIFELRRLRRHEAHSPAFEVIIETPARKKTKKPSAPAITHPWRLMNYRDFLVSRGMNVYEANHVVYQTSK